MNFSKSGKIFMVMVVAAVLAFAVTSFAGWGRGQGSYGYPMGPGYGMHGAWAEGPVITSYSIHYTKLYEKGGGKMKIFKR